jgi:hypothetical protein
VSNGLTIPIEEFNTRLERIAKAAAALERQRLRDFLQDHADAALGVGEFALGERLVQIIGQIEGGTIESIGEAQEMLVPTPEPEPELPAVHLTTDEEDMNRILRLPTLARPQGALKSEREAMAGLRD